MIFEKDKDNTQYICIYTSEAQQSSFNTPYQMGMHGKRAENEQPATCEFDLKEGQVIVVYSDGVSDNLYPYEIEILVNEFADIESDEVFLNNLSGYIAQEAYFRSLSICYLSPFAKEAQKIARRKHYIGGKKDDITVIVGKVVKKRPAKK